MLKEKKIHLSLFKGVSFSIENQPDRDELSDMMLHLQHGCVRRDRRCIMPQICIGTKFF